MYSYSKKNVELAIGTICKYNNLLLVGGNGGSAEQAAHFVAELTGSFNGNKSTYPAMAMGCNTAELTAFANDFGYENIFIRYAKVFYNLLPVYMFITTSGTSENIEKALFYLLKEKFIPHEKIILLTGSGEKLRPFIKNSDINIITCDYTDTAIIQEAHLHILHNIADGVKNFPIDNF